MAATFHLFFVFAFYLSKFVAAHDVRDWPPCPFNETCYCLTRSASCLMRDQSLPVFTSPDGQKYEFERLFINHKRVYHLPSDYFSVFKKIGTLILVGDSSNCEFSRIPQEWNEQAFNGVEIENLEVINVDFVIQSAALRHLGLKGLQSLALRTPQNPVDLLPAMAFSDFPSLKRLSLDSPRLFWIDPLAFQGSRLEELDMSGVNLTSFPVTVPSASFSKLKMLNLARTNLKSFDLVVIAGAQSDVTLNLGSNPNLENVFLTPTDNFPQNASIILSNTGLKSISNSVRSLLEQYPESLKLDISYNTLKCPELDWLCPFVFCTKTVDVSEAKCSDQKGIFLVDYLLMNTSVSEICPKTKSEEKKNFTGPHLEGDNETETSENVRTAPVTPFYDMPEGSSAPTDLKTRPDPVDEYSPSTPPLPILLPISGGRFSPKNLGYAPPSYKSASLNGKPDFDAAILSTKNPAGNMDPHQSPEDEPFEL